MTEDEGRIPALAEAAVDLVRDALGRIEQAAQQDDDLKWLDLSRRFAMTLAPLRDYLNRVQLGQDQPHFLARKLEPLLTALDEVADLNAELGLVEHVSALRRLAHEARSNSSR